LPNREHLSSGAWSTAQSSEILRNGTFAASEKYAEKRPVLPRTAPAEEIHTAFLPRQIYILPSVG